MNQTISYYDEHAEEFCKTTIDADMSLCRDRFLDYIERSISISTVENGNRTQLHILDAGCGSGRDAKAFMEAGYQVTAIDASAKVCEEAEKLLGQKVLCMSFEDMDFQEEFHGIWACASLLHISRENIDDVLKRLWFALKDDGVLYASFKYGEGERIANGRFFNDYQEDSLTELIIRNHFHIEELFLTQDVRQGREQEQWINVLVKKPLS